VTKPARITVTRRGPKGFALMVELPGKVGTRALETAGLFRDDELELAQCVAVDPAVVAAGTAFVAACSAFEAAIETARASEAHA
jgi:hypothetical protein